MTVAKRTKVQCISISMAEVCIALLPTKLMKRPFITK